MSPLDDYRRKRTEGATPEPFGGRIQGSSGHRGRFVIHKHAARNLHYDLRLEHGGTLMSWAVPRGPSLDPAEKRMAVRVEDHPLEYSDFEGLIPKGNYGAGSMIVWDRGGLRWAEDPDAGFVKGKLLFELEGYKLRGLYTLVRTKRQGGKESVEWLFIKERDGFASRGTLPEESVLSGLLVEDLAMAAERATKLAEDVAQTGATRGSPPLDGLSPMLAEASEKPFSKPGWLFELKYDGHRALGERKQGASRLVSRRGHDVTRTYPEIARAIAALPYSLILDGEICAFDAEGRPDITRVQVRAQATRPLDIERASAEAPLTFVVFDLLGLEGFDTRSLPLTQRKALLAKVLPASGPLRLSAHVEERGEDLYREVTRRGLEGMIAKRADSTYRAGRSPAWRKVKAERTDDFVIVGFTAPKGSRTGFGALDLANYVQGELIYAGKVGSGFDDHTLTTLRQLLEPLRQRAAPCTGPIEADKTRAWVTPKLVCEVRFLEWIANGLLRFPVFLRMRDDKSPEACVREVRSPVPADATPPPPPEPRPAAIVTNPKKVLWPDDGMTKSDLVSYYRDVAPFMLVYLRDRSLVMTRYPDGITGKTFFQHDAPPFIPTWIRTERLYAHGGEKEVDTIIVDDVESLAWVANLAAIPLHVWASRMQTIETPDWCSIDLDPKGAPFSHVIRIAQSIHRLTQSLEIPAFAKTSGQAGLHVLIPMSRTSTHDQARMFATLLAQLVAQELPEIATMQRVIELRGGRVYLDTLQNGRGKVLVAPFSVRPKAGAPISMPLLWTEVEEGLDPQSFTIRTMRARMDKLGEDPMAPVLGESIDLPLVLQRIAKRIAPK